MENERSTHESYGQIHFSRTNGRENFYGSELTQEHYITMEVRNSEIIRDLTHDRYHPIGVPLIKIRMSSGQFSELITSMNSGTGTTCTIERLKGAKVADLPQQESRKEFVHREFQERMKDFAKTIKEKQVRAAELVKKKSLSKDDIRELTFHLDWLSTEITSNIPFFAEMFQETMDKVVFEAKTEVENAIQHKISVLGLNALHEQNNLLINNGGENK